MPERILAAQSFVELAHFAIAKSPHLTSGNPASSELVDLVENLRGRRVGVLDYYAEDLARAAGLFEKLGVLTFAAPAYRMSADLMSSVSDRAHYASRSAAASFLIGLDHDANRAIKSNLLSDMGVLDRMKLDQAISMFLVREEEYGGAYRLISKYLVDETVANAAELAELFLSLSGLACLDPKLGDPVAFVDNSLLRSHSEVFHDDQAAQLIWSLLEVGELTAARDFADRVDLLSLDPDSLYRAWIPPVARVFLEYLEGGIEPAIVETIHLLDESPSLWVQGAVASACIRLMDTEYSDHQEKVRGPMSKEIMYISEHVVSCFCSAGFKLPVIWSARSLVDNAVWRWHRQAKISEAGSIDSTRRTKFTQNRIARVMNRFSAPRLSLV